VTTPTPRSALTPKVMLATSLHAQPGVYAVLLGSGVSTGAGIPTGWGVVKELVRRVAAVANPEDPATAAEAATENPEVWWQANGGGEPLGYSSLLADLAPTAATRQGILASFFEPSDADREEGNRTPSAAHKALAKLVKRGTVRVILTTNFDRLMEQALETEGVSPQVISRPEAVHGMAPLAHAKATVVKLHGDYSDLGLRNIRRTWRLPSRVEPDPRPNSRSARTGHLRLVGGLGYSLGHGHGTVHVAPLSSLLGCSIE